MISASAMWTIFFAYLAALGALTVPVTAKGSEPMRRTIWTLIAVCGFGTAFEYFIAQDWRYSAYMVLVNALACWIITRHPAWSWQALIGWSFIIQIGTDTGRVAVEINGGAADMNFIYWETTLLAYLQLLFVVGWGIDELRHHYSRRNLDPSAAPSRTQGVA